MLAPKVFTQRNWLLWSFLLINVLVILYIHHSIGKTRDDSHTNCTTVFPQDSQLQPVKNEALLMNESKSVNKFQSSASSEPPAVCGTVVKVLARAAIDNLTEVTINRSRVNAAVIDKSWAAPNSKNINTNLDNTTDDEKSYDERLRSILKCYDRPYDTEILQRGKFWVLKNYIPAEHGTIRCHETITYTTHADYTYLDNLIPLLKRWNAPISIAMHAPGADFQPTLDSIEYLRHCLPESQLVRMFTTFHIYFSYKHMPNNIRKISDPPKTGYDCKLPPPYRNVGSSQLYKTKHKLLYPVNVGRNIARDAALTHFILASDIELYPSPELVKMFLNMIARDDAYLKRKFPKVYPLPIFEVKANLLVPKNKTELQLLLRTSSAIPFHERICADCHIVPKYKEWIAANETDTLNVFHVGKRIKHWEPIYIGTHADPHYDERLSWDGKRDKMTQGYALCVLDYEFHILDNAFLVHKPGIKMPEKDHRREKLFSDTKKLMKNKIFKELKILYGVREGCIL